MSNSEYKAKLLYDQTCVTEESVTVFSSVYSVVWTYPGAISQTSARVRITCIYSYEGTSFLPHAATIEKWRNEGWSLIDEYHDDREMFASPHEFRARILKVTESFLLGMPLNLIDHSYLPTDEFPSSGGYPGVSHGKSNLSVIDYKTKKDEKKTKAKKKTDKEKSQKKDPDDFDWV